jgi:hypothetical protein
VKPSLREVLVDSHIAAVAIAVLLLWSMDSAFRALWNPLCSAVSYLVTVVAILDIPYISAGLKLLNRSMWMMTFSYLFSAVTCLLAAWLLSRWVYGVGPHRSLSEYRRRIRRRKHA